MTHILQLCDQNLLMQPPSIGRLILADKYGLTELREVCLEYAKSTLLETVKQDVLYNQVESATKVEILDHNLGTLAKEAGNANKALKDIQQLAASSVCPAGAYGYGSYGRCTCGKCNVLRQIEDISVAKGSIKPKGP